MSPKAKTALTSVVVGVVLTGLIGWGAWTTVTVTKACPVTVIDTFKKDNKDDHQKIRDRIAHNQEVIEEKLDEIQKTIIEALK